MKTIPNIKYQISNITKPLLFINFIILVIISAGLMGCENKQKIAVKDEVIPVRVMEVKLDTVKQTLDYVGGIKGQEEAEVFSKVTGKVARKIRNEGDAVKKGDHIVYIDRDEVGLQFESAPVESPLTGVLGRIYVDKGQNINTQTPIALIVDMERIKITLDIPEQYLPRISLGQIAEISVDAYPGERFNGILSKISPVLKIETRAAPVEITIENGDHRLKSGMFANVSLVIEEHKNVPVILKEALIGRGSDTYVYVVEGEEVVSKKVRLGIRQGPYFEVLEGLREKDLVVIMGQQRLRDGAKVSVER